MHYLHRYYLKRANVLTGVASDVNESAVVLEDGREVPYDVLVLATGEEKSFPFSSKQRTIGGRVEELKQFNQFLSTTKKVAIVGGGPMGVSLCAELAEARPELQIDFFHSHAEVLPECPPLVQQYALDHLMRLKNVEVNMCSRVLDVLPSNAAAAVSSLETPLPSSASSNRNFFQRLFSRDSNRKLSTTRVLPDQFTLTVERLFYEPVPPQSIVSQIYFGKLKANAKSFVESVETREGYDYVFSLSGDVPRPIRSKFLEPHITADDHMRSSTLLQLYGLPHVFAVGRNNNLPWARCIGSSEMQSRTLFRMINTIINSPQTKFLHTQDGVQLSRMTIPRLIIRLGTADACGSTPWSGGLTGVNAFREFVQDRAHVMKEYSQPIFYKQQDPKRVQSRISEWKANEITDVTDFSHTA